MPRTENEDLKTPTPFSIAGYAGNLKKRIDHARNENAMAWTYENDTKILARTKTFCYDFGKIGKKTSLKKHWCGGPPREQ